MTSHPLRIVVADLLRRPGATRSVTVEAPVEGLSNGVVAVPDAAPVHLDLTFERVGEGIVVRGDVDATWEAACSRCLQPVHGVLGVHVDELYERDPLAGETYALEDDVLDLEPLVRDALLLELPAAPLCNPDCKGLCASCGIDHNQHTCDCSTDELDPRWAALRSLDVS